MRKSLLAVSLAVVLLVVGFVGSAHESDATFHLMRVYGAMGGAFGNTNIQYVELRMTTGGQNLVAGHDICFYDATGAPYAKFRFAANAPNGSGTASIMIGSTEFDTAWAAGSPDYLFNGSTVTQIAALADVNHPIRFPAGKIAFGTETSMTPAAMCQGSFALIDSVAYGTGYTGSVDLGTKFNTDMPSAGTQAVRLTGQLCTPLFNCTPPSFTPDNSTDYSLLDVNMVANNVRNNANLTGPLSFADADGDGVSDATDNCPSWANPAQNLPSWSVPANDADCDGFTDASETFAGTLPGTHCAATSTANDEASPDAWPVDFNDDQKANVLDVSQYSSRFNSIAPGPPYAARYDFNGDNKVNVLDVSKFSSLFGKSCSP